MKVENDHDIEIADALLPLVKAMELGDGTILRYQLAQALDVTNPGWRDRPEFVARIKGVGVKSAAEGLLRKYGLVSE